MLSLRALRTGCAVLAVFNFNSLNKTVAVNYLIGLNVTHGRNQTEINYVIFQTKIGLSVFSVIFIVVNGVVFYGNVLAVLAEIQHSNYSKSAGCIALCVKHLRVRKDLSNGVTVIALHLTNNGRSGFHMS